VVQGRDMPGEAAAPVEGRQAGQAPDWGEKHIGAGVQLAPERGILRTALLTAPRHAMIGLRELRTSLLGLR